MRSWSRLAPLVAVTVIALLAAGTASAARPHEFKEVFGEPCSAEPCEGAHLKEPDGVAVNEATGDVYVVDRGANRLVRFSEDGVFQSEVTGPSATGTGDLTEGSATVESVLTATGSFSPGEEISGAGIPLGTKIEVVNSKEAKLELSAPVEAGKSAIGVELSAHQRFETPEMVAVDNSCVLRKLKEPELIQEVCEEEDPSSGDVYVVDAGTEHLKEHRVVDKFSAGGAYLGQISENEEGRFFRTVEGVAVDRTGAVWVFQEDGGVRKYTNATPNVLVPSAFVEVKGLPGFALPSLARDTGGNLYVRYDRSGHPNDVGRIAKTDPNGNVLSAELDHEDSRSVAVDQTNDDSLVANTTSIAVFDSEGTLLERLGDEGGEEHLVRATGIAVNAATDSLYAADAGAGTVAIFIPEQPGPPKIERESFSAVGPDHAILSAQINPRSEPANKEAPTEYHFQYGRCATLDPASCKKSAYQTNTPEPDAQIPADFEVHGVSVEILGLESNATYHFRAIAKNSHGAGEAGEEETFTTEGAGGRLMLPDNRGFELVSPPHKHGALIEPISETAVAQAATGGDGITYAANSPTEADPQGFTNSMQVLSTRGGASWSSRDISIPHAGATGQAVGTGPEYKLFDPQLALSVVQPFGEYLALSEEASEQTAYLHDLSPGCGSHCYRPLVTGKPGFANVPEGVRFGEAESCPHEGHIACGPTFLGASDDLAHVVLSSAPALLSGAGPDGLYEWSDGALSQVNLLPAPSGEAVPGSTLGLRSSAVRGAISADGERVVWSTPQALYQRDTARGETAQLDAATCGGCSSGGGEFQIARADGARVIFSDTHRLSSDSGAEPTGSNIRADLYECKIPIGVAPACELTDLTPKHGEEGAAVQGGVVGASEDGAYLYFVARGVQSEEANAQEKKAEPGQANLYVRHEGATSFITTLSNEDSHDWSADLAGQPTRVSPNGRFLELMSQASLTGYDNRDVATGKAVAEVYIYDASTRRLACASCEPSGARPVGVEYRKLKPGEGGLVGGPNFIWPEAALVGANVPGWTAIAVAKSRHQPRYLADSGRLFFDSADALAPSDANATQDVYEYEPAGVGDCEESSAKYSPRSGGCVALISSGSSAQESAFMDASESGDDVFFLTASRLSPLDNDNALDIYDAHVCTGISPCITFPPETSPPCDTESSCKASPTPQPAIFGAPASATLSGPGNPPPPALTPPKVKTPEEIRAEHLAKALKSCRTKKSKHKRALCTKQAHKRYGKPKAKKQSKHKQRGNR